MANAHDVHHAHDDHGHGSAKSYIIGFVLSIILTAIPFALAMSPMLSKSMTVLVIVAMAVIQVVVHLVFFLHMDRSKEQRSNVSTFLFTTLVIALLVGLSLWIIFSIHYEMLAK